MTEVQDKRLVFEAFLRPCGSEIPVLEASNTAVLDFHAYFLSSSVYDDTKLFRESFLIFAQILYVLQFLTMPSKCDVLPGRFAPQCFQLSRTCRFCDQRLQFNNVVTEWKSKLEI